MLKNARVNPDSIHEAIVKKEVMASFSSEDSDDGSFVSADDGFQQSEMNSAAKENGTKAATASGSRNGGTIQQVCPSFICFAPTPIPQLIKIMIPISSRD